MKIKLPIPLPVICDVLGERLSQIVEQYERTTDARTKASLLIEMTTIENTLERNCRGRLKE